MPEACKAAVDLSALFHTDVKHLGFAISRNAAAGTTDHAGLFMSAAIHDSTDSFMLECASYLAALIHAVAVSSYIHGIVP